MGLIFLAKSDDTKGAAVIATLPKSEAKALVDKMLRADVLAEVRAAA